MPKRQHQTILPEVLVPSIAETAKQYGVRIDFGAAADSSITPRRKQSAVPLPEARGLSREEAAGYVGVGSTKFDLMVSDGRMPKPKCIDGRRVWDRLALDKAFSMLPDGGSEVANPWDE